VTALVYVFTPLTAAGPEGQPRGFFTNTRYLMPGLLLGLMLLPIAEPLRSTPRRAAITLGFLTVVYAITVLTTPWWLIRYLLGAVILTLALVWAPAGLGYLRNTGRIGRLGLVGGLAAVLCLLLVVGRAQQVQYSENHYTDGKLFLQGGGPSKMYEMAREWQDKRIGVAGSGAIFFAQYGLYGADRSNYVQYVGVESDRGTYRLATSCEQFRRKINEGDFDYLVTTQYTQDSPDAKNRFPVRAWIKDDPAVRELNFEDEDYMSQPAWVYEIKGELDPAGCGDSGPDEDGDEGSTATAS
jgi:hypothetical protein